MDLVEKAIIKVQSGSSYENVGLLIQQFPSPPYIQTYRDPNSIYFEFFSIATAVTLAMFITITIFVYYVVYEKGEGIKFYLRFYGIRTSILWSAWIISFFIFLFVIMLVPIAVTCVLLPNSSISLIIFVYFSFLLTTLAFVMVFTVFFQSAHFACIIACFFFLFAFLPSILLAMRPILFLKYIGCFLFHSISMGLIFFYFAIWEFYGVGGNWSNLFTTPLFPDGFSIGHGIAMLYLNTIVYMLIALYMERVAPGKYFVRPGCCFCCKKKKHGKEMDVLTNLMVNSKKTTDNRMVEFEEMRIEYPMLFGKGILLIKPCVLLAFDKISLKIPIFN